RVADPRANTGTDDRAEPDSRTLADAARADDRPVVVARDISDLGSVVPAAVVPAALEHAAGIADAGPAVGDAADPSAGQSADADTFVGCEPEPVVRRVTDTVAERQCSAFANALGGAHERADVQRDPIEQDR